MNRSLPAMFLPVSVAFALALSSCGSSTSTPAGSPMSSGSQLSSGAHLTSSGGGMMDGSSAATSSSAATGAPAVGAHNSADVTFATGMIPHHGQALLMADMAAKTAHGSAVKALGARIQSEQAPEIATMAGWLKGWGKPVPPSMAGHGMASGSGSMDGSMNGSMGGSLVGMMSGAQMSALSKATGTGFDRMWLTTMTAHHQGAVTMAKTEIATGTNAQAKALAQSIITGQTSEIAQMKTMLAGS